ncbi:MAG: sigma 54-interacting transcriptional regulator [Bacteroidota bacterium]
MVPLHHELSIKEWLIDALPYEVIWADELGEIMYANAKFCKRLGYKKSELLKLSIYDINVTVTKESWKNHWEIVKADKVQYFKAIHKTKSGKFYDAEVFAQFFSNNGKDIVCSIVNDITESSFYKGLLKDAESIANVGGWKFNLQDNSILVTEEAFRIFDTEDKEDFLMGNAVQFFKDEHKAKQLFRDVWRNGKEFDAILETKTVPSKFIRASAKPVKKGDKIFKIIGIYQDVTEQQKKENRLKFFKEIIDKAQDLIYVYNRDGKLLHYSETVSQQLGFSKKQLDHFYIYDLDANITREWWHEHFDDLKEKGSMHMEWLITRKDGTKFPADIMANHLMYEGEDINCAVVRNITERKMRDLKLFEALEEIKTLKNRLENENEYLQEEIKSKINADNIICTSENYAKVLEQVQQVASTDTTVLITGESGTGKELLASAIHNNSLRKERPLIKINCATLPKELIESELFGHKKGAFTGAVSDKIGKFSLADGGTIFLDEIGELPLDLQPKLLRVLQEGEFDMLGGSKTMEVNVRIVTATNRNLEEMVEKGTFREDLYYRLNVFPIHNIPLRARKEDIPLLAQFFLEKYSAKAGKQFKRLSKKTISLLMEYNFPGNIRELENLIERAVIIENGTTLQPGEWMPKSKLQLTKNEFKSFEEAQREYIIDVLNFTNWRVSGPKGAATILDMKDKTLFAKMKKLGIEKQVGLKR